MKTVLIIDDDKDFPFFVMREHPDIIFHLTQLWFQGVSFYENYRSIAKRHIDLVLIDCIGTGAMVDPKKDLKPIKSPIIFISSAVEPIEKDFDFLNKDSLNSYLTKWKEEK